MNIIVIGGGISGMRAALSLTRRGHGVTLLERNSFLGGRVFSFATPDFGETDIGQHVWLKCCVALERFLADLGVPESDIFRQENFAIQYRAPGGKSSALRASALPFPFHLLPGLLRFPGLGAGDKFTLMRGMARAKLLSEAALERLDARSFADWLQQHGQSEAVIRALWEPVSLSVCNQRSDTLSARHALFTFRESLLKSRHAADVCLLRAPLSAVFDRRAGTTLAAAGVTVHTGAMVNAVRPGALPRVEWREGNGAQTLTGDRVLLALPQRARHALLQHEAGASSAGVAGGESAIAGLLLKFARPVMTEPFFAALDSDIQWVFNKSWVRREENPDGAQMLEIVISGANQECAEGGEKVAARLLPALARLLPAVNGTPLLAQRFVPFAAATFAMPPGAESSRPAFAIPLAENIFPAGDQAATGWPSTMESAARAGEMAAAVVPGGRE